MAGGRAPPPPGGGQGFRGSRDSPAGPGSSVLLGVPHSHRRGPLPLTTLGRGQAAPPATAATLPKPSQLSRSVSSLIDKEDCVFVRR